MGVRYHYPIIFSARESSRLTARCQRRSEPTRRGCYGDAAREGRAPAAGGTAAFITCRGDAGVAPGEPATHRAQEHAQAEGFFFIFLQNWREREFKKAPSRPRLSFDEVTLAADGFQLSSK